MAHRAARLGLLAIVATMLVPGRASAQGWLSDRSRAEGPGFRVGNLELHPGFGAEFGYDSNLFNEDQGVDGSALMRLTAHLLLSTLGQQRSAEGESETGGSRMVQFRGGVNASFYHFFDDRVGDNVAGDASLALSLNPAGRFGATFTEVFGRSVRPFVDATASGSVPNYARNSNTVGVGLFGQSPGGVLRGTLGYSFKLDFFEDNSFDYVNNFEHVFQETVSWRFLPNTALVQKTEVTLQAYQNADDGPTSALSDNVRIDSSLALNGAITNTLSASVSAGYGAGFYDDGEEFDSVTARLDLRYVPRPSIQLGGGYVRFFQPSFIGNFVKSDQLYVKSQFLFAGSFLAGADASLSFEKTGLTFTEDGMTALGNRARREDKRLRAGIFAEYRFTNWLALTASFNYMAVFTDYQYNDPIASMEVIPDPGAGFQKFDVWGGIRVFY